MAKQKLHRGRFQAQGNGTEESVPWSLVKPITKLQADSSLAKLETKLTPAERSTRIKCFEIAHEFVRRAPSYGISAFFKHSCVPFPPIKDTRVDIDVLSGTAFVDD